MPIETVRYTYRLRPGARAEEALSSVSVKETLKTRTVLETVLSFVGFGMASLLWQFV
ncbi:hypothetical protein [Pengzhenrongella sp.]|uniref:hypothetical protein n=1 Tax=Pengzhenrongella sp. TaxID=2888820 RepID=UPI002F925E7F